MVDWFDWKFWLVIIAVVLGTVLSLFYVSVPSTNVSADVIHRAVQNENELIVVYYVDSLDELLRLVAEDYPDYLVAEYFRDEIKHRFIVRLIRKGAQENEE